MAVSSPEKTRSLTNQTFWFAAAKTIAFAVSIVFPFLLVRLISQTEFGVYKQAFLVTTTVTRILSMGFGLSAFFFFPRAKGNEAPLAASIMVFNCTMGALAWISLLIEPNLLTWIFKNNGLTPYAPLLGCVIFLWMLSSFLEVAPAAMQDTAVSTMLIVAVQLSRTVFMLIATLMAASVESLLWAAVVQGICQTLCLIVYLNRRCPGFIRQFSIPVFRTQMAYALPLSVAYFIGVIGMDISQYLVAAHVDPAMFAIYAAGTFSLPLMSVLHESVGMVMVPALSKLHHEGLAREIIRLQAAAMRKMAAITIPAWLCLVVVSEPFIIFLYTSAYRESAPLFAVNMTLLPLMVIIYDPLMRVYSETRRYMVLVRAVLLVFLVIGVTAALRMGSLRGAVSVSIAIAAAERFAVGYKLARLLGMTWKDWRLFRDIGKIAFCSIVAAGPAWVCRTATADYHPAIVLALSSAVYGIVYVSAVFAIKLPQQNERDALMHYVRKFLPVRASQAVPTNE